MQLAAALQWLMGFHIGFLILCMSYANQTYKHHYEGNFLQQIKAIVFPFRML